MQQQFFFQALFVAVIVWLFRLYSLTFSDASSSSAWESRFESRLTSELHLPYQEFVGTLEVSANDPRQHRLIRLPNNIVVMCTSDYNAAEAAAALSVNVGSFSEPPEFQGLAHFLEHMLFMGSEKYPNEDDYSSFLANNSGSYNAFTANTQTLYYFTVANGALEGALDRLSQFFIAPLFNPDSVDREVNAVDSEFKGNLQSDFWRLYRLESLLSNPSHPYSSFNVGNLKTLRDAAQNLGLSLRDEVVKLYQEKYSSDIIKFTIVGNYSLDQLSEWAASKLSAIESKGDTSLKTTEHPLNADALGKVVHFETVTDIYNMGVEFALPELKAKYKTDPCLYISTLLMDQGPGSLTAYLKKMGWGTSIHAHLHEYADGFEIFPISIMLTPQGINHYEDILRALFAYLKMVSDSGPQKWIHDEVRKASNLDFQFYERPEVDNWVIFTSYGGQNEYIAPEHYLTHAELVRDFNYQDTLEIMKYLNPQNYHVIIGAQNHTGVECNEREEHYGVAYNRADLPMNLTDDALMDGVGSYPFYLPERNRFLPDSVKVVGEKASPGHIVQEPALLRLTDSYELWFKQDDQFLTPRSSIQLKIKLETPSTSPLNQVVAELLNGCIAMELDEEFSSVRKAGISVKTTYSLSALDITVEGFSDKLPQVIDILVKKLRSFTVAETIFDLVKSQQEQMYHIEKYEDPLIQLYHYESRQLNTAPYWPIDARMSVFANVTMDIVQNLIDTSMENTKFKLLVVGNYKESDALQLAARLTDILDTKPMAGHLHVPSRLVDLEPGHYLRRIILDDKGSLNSAVRCDIYLGHNSDVRSQMLAALLEDKLNNALFDQLRTKEQLGYQVHALVDHFASGRDMMAFMVKSESNPVYLIQRVDDFIRQFRQKLVEYTSDVFDNLVESMVSVKTEKLKTIYSESAKFWAPIDAGSYDFDRLSQEVAVLNQLRKEDLLEMWDMYFNPDTAPQYTRVDYHAWSAKLSYPSDGDLESYPENVIALHGCLDSEGVKGIELAELDRFVESASLTDGINSSLDDLRNLYKGKPETDQQNLDRITDSNSRIGTALEMALQARNVPSSGMDNTTTNFANLGMPRTPEGKWVINNVNMFKATQKLHGLSVPATKLVPKYSD
ncbi:metalloprotease [Coemansia sp. RSA 552]|nr:metalloprotease [Coemansia sp. RSA 552]